MRAINVLEGTYPNELIDEEEFVKKHLSVDEILERCKKILTPLAKNDGDDGDIKYLLSEISHWEYADLELIDWDE